MNKQEYDELKQELDELEEIMHDTEQFHTLEEQIEDMKRRGIDPHDSYQNWGNKEIDQNDSPEPKP